MENEQPMDLENVKECLETEEQEEEIKAQSSKRFEYKQANFDKLK